MRGAAFAGTPTLVRLALRRDRLRLAIWVVVVAALVAFTAQSIFDLYDSQQDLVEYAVTVDTNAALVAMSGPAHHLDTFGGRIAWELWIFGVAVALLGALTVVRHTRAAEEAGRTELLRSAQVGRHAHSAAALAIGVGASVMVGAAVTVVLLPFDLPASGAFLLGAGFASVGTVFAAVALLAAQITTHARAASGAGIAAIGASFVVRAAGDAGNGSLSWLSPLGWMQATQAYAGDRWWPLLLRPAFTALLAAGAVALERIRDVGGGLVADRPGPAEASPALGSATGLAWRLQRGALVAWACGLLLGGVVWGSIADSADDLVGDNEAILAYLADLGDATLAEVFLGTILVYLGLLAAAYAISAVNRMRSEETAGRAEWLLATATSRGRWTASHLVVAATGSALALFVSGVGMGISYGLTTGDVGEVPRLAFAALAYVPPVWLLGAVAFAVYGTVPRLGAVVWALLGAVVVIDLLGDGLGLPSAVLDLSPFGHVGQVPASAPSATALAVLLVATAGLVLVGRAGIARRDLSTQ